MRTILTNSAAAAAAFVRRGQIVAFPTETVYGLGGDAFNAEAVHLIFEAKGRPADNPLIVHLGHPDQLRDVVREVPPVARRLMRRFFPGPLTLVLPRHHRMPAAVSAGLDTVAVRMPASPIAQDFLRGCATPVAAPSANRSGRPSPTVWRAVFEDLDGAIPCVLQGPPSVAGLESTVVDCTSPEPLVLRAGAVTLEELRAVAPGIAPADGDEHMRRSPGTRHRHYAPDAVVCLVDGPQHVPEGEAIAYIGLAPIERPLAAVVTCADAAEYAQRLYAFFREAEALGVRTIYAQRIPETGLGLALMDRLRRAAAA